MFLRFIGYTKKKHKEKQTFVLEKRVPISINMLVSLYGVLVGNRDRKGWQSAFWKRCFVLLLSQQPILCVGVQGCIASMQMLGGSVGGVAIVVTDTGFDYIIFSQSHAYGFIWRSKYTKQTQTNANTKYQTHHTNFQNSKKKIVRKKNGQKKNKKKMKYYFSHIQKRKPHTNAKKTQ